MRILLIGDASNYHRALAGGLRSLGQDVVIASNGSRWMNTERDIDISRKPGKISGGILWLQLMKLMLTKFRGYDIVEISNPIFIDQRPNRNNVLFKYLKNHNKSIFLSGLGTDTEYIRMSLDPKSKLKYNEWFVNGQPTPYHLHRSDIRDAWLNDPLKSHCDMVYNEIDGIVTALYEYNLSCQRTVPAHKVAYGGIPIDTEAISPVHIPERPSKVKLFLGMHSDRKLEKGTDRMLAAAKKVVEKYPDKCTLDIVENLPYNIYLERLRNAHVVLDQLYSYTPATNALLAMAMGLNTISGGEEDFYNFIGEKDMRPVINALPDDDALYRTIEDTVLHPELIRPRGMMGREFVRKHNDSTVVAKRFIDFWSKRLEDKRTPLRR